MILLHIWSYGKLIFVGFLGSCLLVEWYDDSRGFHRIFLKSKGLSISSLLSIVFWAWIKFLNVESKEELDMIVEERSQTKIGKAVAHLEELSQEERARMLFESLQMLEWDIKLGQEAAVAKEMPALSNTAVAVKNGCRFFCS